jgi:hypothetical protein
MREPAAVVDDVERDVELASGSGERFFGYGVMGLPFRSGHVLGLRRIPASSIGPGYRSVWHRDPHGRWTFYQDQPAELACTRYFGTRRRSSATSRCRSEDCSWSGARRSCDALAACRPVGWPVSSVAAPSRAQPLIPALTPPAQRGQRWPRAVETPVIALSGGASRA